MNINIAVYAVGIEGAGSTRIVLTQVQQTHPPKYCFSFSDGVLRFAPEDVKRFRTFTVRLWTHPRGDDVLEYTVLSSALDADGEAPGRITRNEEEDSTVEAHPPRLEGSSR